MFDLAALEAEWQAFDAAPGGYDDVEPPPDCWGEPPTITDRIRALSATVGWLAADIRAAAAQAADADLLNWLSWLAEVTDRLPTADHAIVAEVDARGVHDAHLYPSTARMLTGQLHVRPAVAKARVAAARTVGPRRTLTGEPLPPLREHVAAAQAAGAISADHAQVITGMLERVPSTVDPAVVVDVEQVLVELADQVDPVTLARGCREALERLDPDGAEPRAEDLERRRGLVLHPADDGSGRVTGTLTPDVFAALQTVLSPLAAPKPTDDQLGRDTRSAAQRHHDALAELCARFLRSGTLPDSGGTPTTVIVSMTLEQLEARAGLAMTQFGGSTAVDRLLKYAGQCEFIPVVLGDGGGVLAYGTTRRVATPGQTKALIARDKGCIISGCTTPHDWCERHHVIPFADGGCTDLDNLVLICRYHHRMFDRAGWDIVMVAGRPYSRPPALIDPDRKLIRNTHWDAFDAPDGVLRPRVTTPEPPDRKPVDSKPVGLDPLGLDPLGLDPLGLDPITLGPPADEDPDPPW